MEDAIRLYVAAVLGSEEAGDGEIVRTLVRCGMEAAMAERLVVLGPLAFGRQILDGLGPEFAASSIDGEPDFVALREYARHAGREEIRAIGLRSAEVNAVNAALNAGSKPEDLMLGAPALRVPLPPLPRVPDDLFGARTWLRELMSAHGVIAPWQVAVFPRGVAPSLARLQLDLRVPVGERAVVESFAGTGGDVGEAVRDAVGKLARASLHVLLAAFVEESLGGNQVEWEQWGAWRVCSGALLLQFSSVEGLGYGAFLDSVRGQLPALSEEPHWLRVFHARRGDEVIAAEVLLDNQPWTAAQEALAAWPWPRSEELYAFRHFLVLLPTR